MGGFIFLTLEGPTGSAEETSVAASKPNLSQTQNGDLRSKTVERLWSITEDLNILYKENWTKLAAKELMDFQKVLMTTIRKTDTPNMSRTYDPTDYRWTFAGSFLYALTLITTIGKCLAISLFGFILYYSIFLITNANLIFFLES